MKNDSFHDCSVLSAFRMNSSSITFTAVYCSVTQALAEFPILHTV